MNTNDSVVRRNQTLQKVGQCLYRSNESDVYYAIFKRGGKQVKRSLKTSDKALAHRLLADLHQKVTRLKTASGSKLMFSDLAERWLGTIGGRMAASDRQRQNQCLRVLHAPSQQRHCYGGARAEHAPFVPQQKTRSLWLPAQVAVEPAVS